ncbi:MAG: hypothetical protein M1832_002960 [Thelocarpon impressellum]|nr:MAG: hypothetical protein M1832_002960 [Thelocarpon impressellum]
MTTLKRKQPGAAKLAEQSAALDGRARKRAKTQDARQIAVQASDKALKNGELDVDKFVKARQWEIRALEAGMRGAKKALTTRAHQSVPREMRRRTASHNVKRLPKRLRPRAAEEMAKDNTPTVTSKTRKPKTTRARLRLETAKHLDRLAARAKAKKSAGQGSSSDAEAEGAPITTSPPEPKTTKSCKKNSLAEPPRPHAKYRKRQLHKTWLPTHIFHSKRAHMTAPKEPLWRFAIPLTPTDKSYRPTHRASRARGAVAWDTSFIATIGLEGREEGIEKVLKTVGVDSSQIAEEMGVKRARKWREGKRARVFWTSDPEARPSRAMAPVTVVWCAQGASSQSDVEMADAGQEVKKTARRQALIRVHPSAFLRLWEVLLLSAKRQHPPVAVEDLRFEIGSIEITGPASTEALLGTLKPSHGAAKPTAGVESPEETWMALHGLTNAASLPADAVLGFTVRDPRLQHPPRALPTVRLQEAEDRLLHVLSTWPADRSQAAADVFDRGARLKACRDLPSQKAINRRKGLAPPGAYPDALPTDPRIPVLLITSHSTSTNGQGVWTVLLPWRCVLPVWYTLMHQPLSSGGNVRFGGLRESRQIIFEAGGPWFPGDYPGTAAGWDWEMAERARRKSEWERRPKGKRTEWATVDLGRGRKGEIGEGWACDWGTIMHDRPEAADDEVRRERKRGGDVQGMPAENGADPSAGGARSQAARTERPQGLHQLPYRDAAAAIKDMMTGPGAQRQATGVTATAGLTTVKVTLLSRGAPAACARIYRLPSNDATLRQKWLDLLPSRGGQARRPKWKQAQTLLPPDAPASERRTVLAASLLEAASAREGPPQAGDPDYPAVPDSVDLMGFITTGGFSLADGQGVGIGGLSLERAVIGGGGSMRGHGEGSLCIVREAGRALGRLARWEAV